MIPAWDLFQYGIERWELIMLTPYRDKGDPPPWAIGLGHTNVNGLPPFVDENTRLKDDDEARAIFKNDIEKVYIPQLDALFRKANFTPPNEYYKLGFLGALYNRGYGRLEKSLAYDWLKHPERPSVDGKLRYMVEAANALSHSHAKGVITLEEAKENGTVNGFVALDMAWNDDAKAEIVYPGLVARRSFDNALCMWERF